MNQKEKLENIYYYQKLIQNKWYNISQNTLLNLVKSMSCKIKAVIKSNGNPTKY